MVLVKGVSSCARPWHNHANSFEQASLQISLYFVLRRWRYSSNFLLSVSSTALRRWCHWGDVLFADSMVMFSVLAMFYLRLLRSLSIGVGGVFLHRSRRRVELCFK